MLCGEVWWEAMQSYKEEEYVQTGNIKVERVEWY